jgi:homoserine kinase type II
MAVKTILTDEDFTDLLAEYRLGSYVRSEGISKGSVQTNYILHTTQSKFVCRHYENRTRESVLFECDLLEFLREHDYPCPTPIRNSEQVYVGSHLNKPYVIFDFLEGSHIKEPTFDHWQQLVQRAAELHTLSEGFSSPHVEHRWNYDTRFCAKLANEKAKQILTQDASDKLTWLIHQLDALDLPPSLPKGVCHCDFHFSNALFQDDEFVALLDFDDANFTYFLFDLVGLIEYWAWPHTSTILDLEKARSVVQEYEKHRPLSSVERQHLFDVYKLSILIDCVWYFGRGSSEQFYEKSKIDGLDGLSRQKFFDKLFCT